MAKDPAVLFYTSDFLSGTFTMTNEQKGKYITLLCLQHQQGYLTEQDLIMICGGEDEKVFSKFSKNGDGNYYNDRMKTESEKRRAYTESRRKNLEKNKEHINNHMKDHMGDHMENENENINENINKEYIIKIKNEKNLLKYDLDYYSEAVINYYKTFKNYNEFMKKVSIFINNDKKKNEVKFFDKGKMPKFDTEKYAFELFSKNKEYLKKKLLINGSIDELDEADKIFKKDSDAILKKKRFPTVWDSLIRHIENLKKENESYS